MWGKIYITFVFILNICDVFFLRINGVTLHVEPELTYLTGRAKQLAKLHHYDITMPYRLDGRRRRDTQTLTQEGHLKETTFVLEVNGEEITVDLALNEDLFPPKYIQRSYLPDGRLLTRKPHKLHHCYYHGEVRGKNTSRVALSTCSGLNGLIIIDGKSHYVEPLSGSEMEHIVYTPDNVKRKKETWVYDTDLYDKPPENVKTRVRRDSFDEIKYVELVIVADHTEFLQQESDEQAVFSRCKEIANIMDVIYRPLNMRIALIGVEVWNAGDLITVSTKPTVTMDLFQRWRKENLLPDLYNDNAQFLTGKSFDGSTVGMATLSAMCSLEKSGGVSEDHGVNAADAASTMAHEMGHNMGFYHDDKNRNCQCDAPDDDGCIMEPSSGYTPPTIFSSCTRDDLTASLMRGLGVCLFDYPKAIFQGPHCGNAFLEKGEECDCGTAEECTNNCCVPEKCILHENATCAQGECCEDCQLREAGVICREGVNQCDLPEYCTGIDNECPGNVYRQNGEPCADMVDVAVCYNGQCVTYDDQCIAMWGEGATKAHDICFDFNEQGSIFGNCGTRETTGEDQYIPCIRKNFKCGKLMCVGGAESPIIGSNADARRGVRYVGTTQHFCNSANIVLGEDIPDPGYVMDGSPCGTSINQICVDMKCQNRTDLNIRDCPFNCFDRGVCNSNNHCHCDPEWAPPLCKTKGYGGSIDSGPARPQGNENAQIQGNSIVALLVVFLVVVPFVIIGGIAAFVKRRELQKVLCKKSSAPPPVYQRPIYKPPPAKRPSRQGFSHVPDKSSSTTNGTNGYTSSWSAPKPDIVASVNEPSWNDSKPIKPPHDVSTRPPISLPQRPTEPDRPRPNIVRRESSKRKPNNPPPPVPSAPSNPVYENHVPTPVRKAPTKPIAAADVHLDPAPKPPSVPQRPPQVAFKPPLPKAPSFSSDEPPETPKPGVALRPPVNRPPPVPKPKFNANNSATSQLDDTPPKPAKKPVVPPRPESVRIKDPASKSRPAIPRRPASTSDGPTV